MKTCYVYFEKIPGYPEFEWGPRDSKGQQCAESANEFDDACKNALDAGYGNCIYVPRPRAYVASTDCE